MKQISEKTLRSLALADKSDVARWTEWETADWIKENSEWIAKIEISKTVDKTLFGEWPKGWKAEAKRAGRERAEKALIEKFTRDNVKVLDGAFWLNNYHLIDQLSR